MAKTASYLPTADDKRLTWLENFYLKLITLYVLTFGLTTIQTDALLADLEAMRYTNQLCTAVAKAALACSAYRKSMNSGIEKVLTPGFPQLQAPLLPPTAVQPGIFVRVRKLVKILKANINYDETIGKDLATIGATIVIDFAKVKPTLKAVVNGLVILIKWQKKSTDAIHLYSMRGAETAYTFLATISKASYSDARANLIAGQPETRNYQAWYVVNDVVVGIISTVATISVGA